MLWYMGLNQEKPMMSVGWVQKGDASEDAAAGANRLHSAYMPEVIMHTRHGRLEGETENMDEVCTWPPLHGSS